MNLTPREKDKLLIATAAMVARRRLERGVKLNHPESIALISDFIMEGARDGACLGLDGEETVGVGRHAACNPMNDAGQAGAGPVELRTTRWLLS